MREMNNQIKKVLETFGQASGQGAVFHAADRVWFWKNKQTCAFCSYALLHPVSAGFCRYACLSAGMQTLSSGEPHYQRCWAGLLYVAVATSPRGEHRGGISSGGFYDEGEGEELREMVEGRLQAVPRMDPAPFLARLASLRPISTGALRGLGLLLLENTFSSGLNAPAVFQRRHARYEQQRKIAASLASLRGQDLESPDVFGDTYRLLSYLQRRDHEGAMQFISDYLARLLLVSQWNLPRLRAHVRVLVAVITSQDILAGMDWAAATSREMLTLARMEKAGDVETVCYEVAELVLAHFHRSHSTGDERVPLVDRLLAWLQAHFHERATIAEAARAVGVSVSSLSHRLPAETGKTFRALRLALRISEAKRLLAETDMEISAIADACGFTDQSHFTRHFRQEINMTPGMFRRLLDDPAVSASA